MKRLFVVLFPLFLFASCNQFSGTIQGKLDVAENLHFTTTNIFGSSKEIIIEPGAHQAALSFNLKSVSLKIDKSSAVKFKIEGQSLPPQGGAFYLPASVSGQLYDLQGNIDLTDSYGPVQQTTQSCQKQVMVQVCQNGQCHLVPQTVFGTQWVRYQIKTTTLILDADFLKNERSHGQLHAGGNSYQKLYLYQGPCL